MDMPTTFPGQYTSDRIYKYLEEMPRNGSGVCLAGVMVNVSIVTTAWCRLVTVTAGELDSSVRSVMLRCSVEVLCRYLNISTCVIAALLAVRE
jgi:hypothetical protein